MTQLENKNILLIISGGIAAYKMPEFVRRTKEQGANVRVVMTEGAKAFITPLTLQAVSGEPVADALLDTQAEAAMGHIELAKWADFVIVAPASADMIAKMAQGMANDLASTLLLATAAPVAICPAMNQQMYAHAATQDNLNLLSKRGVSIWGPASGEQACGDVGKGRMIEPHDILSLLLEHYADLTLLQREAIDPVRYISNHSSGKMGYAIAHAAKQLGANVNLISGPVSLQPHQGVNLVSVTSAQDMFDAAMEHAPKSDIFIACAAVADYRPANIAEQKIKKHDDAMNINMVKNPDIVANVAALESNRPFVVGFAAETQDVEKYALGKLTNKKLNMICANDVSNQNIGFNSEQNALKVYWQGGSKDLPFASKQEIAQQLLALIKQQYNK
jgi:phosphopantothenoylcysteine decarboxylase/phosphopantothenate--cysteine ligase